MGRETRRAVVGEWNERSPGRSEPPRGPCSRLAERVERVDTSRAPRLQPAAPVLGEISPLCGLAIQGHSAVTAGRCQPRSIPKTSSRRHQRRHRDFEDDGDGGPATAPWCGPRATYHCCTYTTARAPAPVAVGRRGRVTVVPSVRPAEAPKANPARWPRETQPLRGDPLGLAETAGTSRTVAHVTPEPSRGAAGACTCSRTSGCTTHRRIQSPLGSGHRRPPLSFAGTAHHGVAHRLEADWKNGLNN